MVPGKHVFDIRRDGREKGTPRTEALHSFSTSLPPPIITYTSLDRLAHTTRCSLDARTWTKRALVLFIIFYEYKWCSSFQILGESTDSGETSTSSHVAFERWCACHKDRNMTDQMTINSYARAFTNAFLGVSKAETFARLPCPTR